MRWHYEGHIPTMDISEDHQNKIGWDNIIRGWTNKMWQTQQEKHLRQNFPDNKTKAEKGKNWSLYLIEWLWSQGHSLWKDRCDKAHEKTGRSETAQQRSMVEAKVTALYKQAEHVGYLDRHKMFSLALKLKIKESAPRLERWLELPTPAVKQAVRDYSKRLRKQSQDIRKFFRHDSVQVTTMGTGNKTNEIDNTTTTTTVPPEDNNAPT